MATLGKMQVGEVSSAIANGNLQAAAANNMCRLQFSVANCNFRMACDGEFAIVDCKRCSVDGRGCAPLAAVRSLERIRSG